MVTGSLTAEKKFHVQENTFLYLLGVQSHTWHLGEKHNADSHHILMITKKLI